MSPRVLIPEVLPPEGSARPDAQPGWKPRPAAPGLGSILRAGAAGLVLVTGVAAVFLVGGVLLAVFAVLFVLASLASLLSGKLGGSSRTVVIRTRSATAETGNSRVPGGVSPRGETRRPGA